jgi:xanthine dehydrogenase accessory factor
MEQAMLESLIADRAAHRAVVLATELDTGRQWLVAAGTASAGTPGDVAVAARDALAIDDSRAVDLAGGRVFLHVHGPPLRMIVIGAVHITQALAPMATLAGYQVTVVDPRGAFATSERFPGITVSDDWPDDALEALAPDSRTAVVTLTHDPKLDDAALAVALRTEAFYIGSLGSAKNHRARTERIARLGFDEAAIARIHGPVGLAIGARSPAEIAIAILAQVIEARRRPARAGGAEGRAA